MTDTDERDRLIAALQMSTDQVLEAQSLVRQTIAMVHEARQQRDWYYHCIFISGLVCGTVGIVIGMLMS